LKTVVLIPAYKPDPRMLDVIAGLAACEFDLVVVDDGSGDAYRPLFDEVAKSAVLLRHEVNRGKGAALKTGIAYVDRTYGEPYVIVTADADGQHRIEDIVKVSRVAADHPDSLVLGKRILHKNTPFLSRLGNGTTRLFFHLETGKYVYETQTGLRGFGADLARDFLRIPGKRYEFESDMMLICADRPIIEVDVETVYFDNNAGTHFRPLVDTLRLHREYYRYKLPSLIAAAADYLLFVLLLLVFPGAVIPAQFGSRALSLALKALLHRAIFYSERLRPARYLITCAVILAVETGLVAGLCALGLGPYLAKLLAGFSVIFLSIGLRKLFVTFSK